MTEQFEMLGPLADDLSARLDAMSTDKLNRLIRESEMVTSAGVVCFVLFGSGGGESCPYHSRTSRTKDGVTSRAEAFTLGVGP